VSLPSAINAAKRARAERVVVGSVNHCRDVPGSFNDPSGIFHSFIFVISFPALCAVGTVEPHLKKNWPALPHSDSKADEFADQLQHCAKSEGSDHPLQSANEAAELGYSALGASPLLEQRCQRASSMPEQKRSMRPRRFAVLFKSTDA